jgi:hypothetical protein
MLTWQDNNSYLLKNILWGLLINPRTFDEFKQQIWYAFDGLEQRGGGEVPLLNV